MGKFSGGAGEGNGERGLCGVVAISSPLLCSPSFSSNKVLMVPHTGGGSC